jgi:type I restriction enzyme S subunit
MVSSHYFVFQVDENVCIRSWLDLLSRANLFQEQVRAQGSTNYSAVRPSQVLAFEIPLPPLSEQQRIVVRVDALTRRVEEARGLRRAAVEEAEAVIYSALGQIFRDEATQTWEHKKVEEICHSPQYGYTESAQVEKVGPKFLRITDIQEGRVNWDAVPYCVCKPNDLEKYRLNAGDIVFARTGATTGKSFLIRDCPEAVFASYLIRLRVKDSVLPEYLLWYFQSPHYWDQVKAETKGSAQGNMNGRKLSAVDVRFPMSETDQRRIVAYIDDLQAKVDELRRLQVATQKELDALMPSILAKAFAGEL